ncbi:MAG: YaiO family outer membrane beta-barrel protein [Pseudomonadota bacterium]
MTVRKWVWLLAALLPLGAAAQGKPVDSVLVTAEHSSLDKGLASWSEYSAHWLHDWGGHRVLDTALTRTSRFGLEDTQASLAYATPLMPRLAGSLEATASGSHHVLPKYSLGGALQYEFAPAWLLHGGLKHTRYDGADVERGTLRLEHYFGDFSASAAWSPVRSAGTSASGTEVRGSWFYRDGSSVGFILARGDEATVTAPGVVTLADVRSLALLGKHEFRPGLAFAWSLFRTRQGNFYTREGASVGVQAAF